MAKKAPRRARITSLCAKTKMCKHAGAGVCPEGADCPFAHNPEELKDMPDLMYTRLCKHYLKGYCSAGSTCRFAHGYEMLRTPPATSLSDEQSSLTSESDECSLPMPDKMYMYTTSIEPACQEEDCSKKSLAELGGPGDEKAAAEHWQAEAAGKEPRIVGSLLTWDPRSGSFEHATGCWLSIKNTFLVVSESRANGYGSSHRSVSMPP
eukprot:TRINITY_DN73081_c0_g1_i1.p1 TRINITY_DN73081_c0_g1~~TRINITY_DN73081_c0_g1_i1.p1  ORF type:complete len:208 (+),score=40.34 TRINITY_DN73081_c0_g1_i1:151-774(+)